MKNILASRNPKAAEKGESGGGIFIAVFIAITFFFFFIPMFDNISNNISGKLDNIISSTDMVNDFTVKRYDMKVKEEATVQDTCNKTVTDTKTNKEYILSCEGKSFKLLDVKTKEPIPSNTTSW